MFDEYTRGLSIPERQALARAMQVGYLTKSLHIGYQADEAWHAHCAAHGIPYVAIGSRGLLKVVIVDCDLLSSVLAPTAKARLRLEQIVSRYKARGDYGGSYSYLKNIEASSAELVAQELIVLWQEGKTYGYMSSLWDEQMRGQGVA